MPLAAAAVIGAAGSVYAANQASKANKKAIDAQTTAQQKSLDQQQRQYDTTRQDQMPYMQTGYKALDALATQYGLNAPANQNGSTGGGPDYTAYVANNPDIAAEAKRVLAQDPSQIGDRNGDGQINDTDYGQYHAQTFGDRPVPTTPVTAATPQTQAPTEAARPTFTRPDVGSAPSADAYFGTYEESPEYKFGLEQQMRALNANNATRGLLRSGNLVTSALGRASALQSQDRNNWFGRQNTLYQSALQQYNINADRTNSNFGQDRAFDTGAFESDRGRTDALATQRTDNLFRLAAGGQGALGAIQNSGMNAANQNTRTYQNGANQLSDLYGQQGANSGALAGALVGFGQSALASYGGQSRGGAYTPVQTQTVFNPTAVPSPGYVSGMTNIPQVRF